MFLENMNSIFIEVNCLSPMANCYVYNKNSTTLLGQIKVRLPDGRVQIVKYYADETGFHPEIIYGA